MGVLAAEDGVGPHDIALPVERLEIVGDEQEVRFRRKAVGEMALVPVGDRAELA